MPFNSASVVRKAAIPRPHGGVPVQLLNSSRRRGLRRRNGCYVNIYIYYYNIDYILYYYNILSPYNTSTMKSTSSASDAPLDLSRAPYALYVVKYIDLVSLW